MERPGPDNALAGNEKLALGEHVSPDAATEVLTNQYRKYRVSSHPSGTSLSLSTGFQVIDVFCVGRITESWLEQC